MKLLATSIALAALLAAGGIAAAQSSPAAQRVLDRARAASGGAGWNTLRGLHETGRDGEARYERWIDPVRYGLRTETQGPAGKQVQGYNGFGEWRILPDGGVTGSAEKADLDEIRTDAFLAAYGYFYASRFDQRSSLVGSREAQGRRFDVVLIEPAGGEPRELWFDSRTGLLGFIVDETGPKQGRTELSDYRRVGLVMLPHKAVTFGGGKDTVERTMERADFPTPDRALFSLPRPEEP